MISLRKTLDMIGWAGALPLSIGSMAHERPLSLTALIEKLCLTTWTPPSAPSSPLPLNPNRDVADDPEKLYISLKQIEDKFPFPTPVAILWGGTFFPGSGVPEDWPNSMSGLPVNWKGPDPHIGWLDANAVNVIMRYDYNNPYDQDFDTFDAKLLEVHGSEDGVPMGQLPIPPLPPAVRIGKCLFLNVGGRTYTRDFTVTVELSAGAVKTTTAHSIVRPPLLGMGAYTLPAVPIAIVYEPPQDMKKQNTVTYTEVKSVGTTIQTSVSTEDSTTIPESLGFTDVNTIGSGMQAIGKGLEAAGEAASTTSSSYSGWLKAIGIVVEALSSILMGSHAASVTSDTKAQSDRAVTLDCSEADVTQPTLHKGPGPGDVIVTRKNVHVAWMADPDGGITLYLLPGSTNAPFPVSLLLSELAAPSAPRASGLDLETVQALVNLDPFAVGGPDADLPEPRFCFAKSMEIIYGSKQIFEVTHTIEAEDMTTTVDFTTHAEDQSPGLLACLGIGVTEEKHTKHTQTHSGSRSVKIGDVVKTEAEFYASEDAQEIYGVTAYYDRVFGTFAFKRTPLRNSPVISGAISDSSGQQAAFHLVTLKIAGQEYATHTNREGTYAFRGAHIPAGTGTLTIDGTTRQVELQEGMTVKLDITVRVSRLVLGRRRCVDSGAAGAVTMSDGTGGADSDCL